MKREPWLPNKDTELTLWYENFAAKFALHHLALGFTAADLTAVQKDLAWLNFCILQVAVWEAETSERVAWKEFFKNGPQGEPVTSYPGIGTQNSPVPPPPAPGLLPRLRALVKRIKTSAAYTEAIGLDLGVVGSVPAPPVNIKPLVEAFALPNSEVQGRYLKGDFDAALIESQRGSEPGWTELGIKLKPFWTDARPPLVAGQPEVRKYRSRYMRGDAPVGDYSDVITVTTMP